MDKHTRAALAFARNVRAERGEKTVEIGEFELTTLRHDKKRLDFIEKNAIDIVVNGHGLNECEMWTPNGLFTFPAADTVREAIDNAMALADK
ncbi:hypothetical protein K7G92_000707 [Pasteurella canis]|uniref:hypothetical protein n=1 Tax=Pasteurella canis TaxID=753 RepID=UPI001E5CB878|nr:hypothetical protein [Pasteurella canis]HDR0674168.1 hypothetical protein [Pasteurella multocida]UEA17501.1 hypothetical protein K7G92_000707 [Pasteurella canis]HDR0675974.1 hypothetical protein [Pasteurella multocida]HDR0679141.1 hypothetical protein [Pasteurella multocida]HDR0682993.1 hypothetical protein [Pasteurella multocida]